MLMSKMNEGNSVRDDCDIQQRGTKQNIATASEECMNFKRQMLVSKEEVQIFQ